MQHIVFGVSDHIGHEKIHENVMPVSVLASFVLASIATPFLPQWAGPLAISQARKPQSTDDTISDASQTQKIVRSHTVSGSPHRLKKNKAGTYVENGNVRPPIPGRRSSLSKPDSRSERPIPGKSRRPTLLHIQSDAGYSTASLPLPEHRTPKVSTRPSTPVSASLTHHPYSAGRITHHSRPLSPSFLSPEQKVKLLRQNYFRCQTQFITALEDISNRLVIVPKPARLSALRAELALIAQDLPSEVDIPVICPASLVDGIPSKSKHHRIVRLNPAEATVLNSAEKVPYLLMVEVLRDDFSFDPEAGDNEQLLVRLLSEQGSNRRRIFDLSEAPHVSIPVNVDTRVDSVFEPSQGDIGSSPLFGPQDDGSITKESHMRTSPFALQGRSQLPRLSSAVSTLSTISNLTTPQSSVTPTSRPGSPGLLRRMTLPSQNRSTGPDQPDFSALATHMRTASQMLAQLELTGSKRPKGEVAAIRAKIIASMQSLEEQSFEPDDMTRLPTFDTILADPSTTATDADAEDLGQQGALDSALDIGAGAARMENDSKTGGVQRRGDRDDPSAATFGEAWSMKKERIRKSSPYGWMKNWDVISVIIKTGADLRQEAFACQLIKVCGKIWEDAGTPVWVKQMRILVTGESSGLIETLTNSVSLHSLKRSLTLATIESGQNPKNRIATLKDHFVKTFGAPETESYKAAEDAFKRSLAAYSIISYVLQLKDRHNGNVLIDNEGHIIHIDFGFMLSNSPGSVGFEAAPFKLTQDYVDVLGGVDSPGFEDYKQLCKQAFQGMSDLGNAHVALH